MPITGSPTLASLGGASKTEPFVTIGNTSGLTAERALTGTSNQVIVTDNGANSTVVLSTPQSIGSGSSPTFTGLTLSGLSANEIVYTGTGGLLSADGGFTYDGTTLLSQRYTAIGSINSQTTPNTQTNGGLGVQWNYAGGQAELSLFNLFNGNGFTAGFRFLMGTGANTFSEVAWLSWNGGAPGLKISTGAAFLTLNDWTMTRDAAGSVDASSHFGVNSFDWTSLSANQSGLSSGINLNPPSASSSRVWGLFFGASGNGSVNLTDNLALNGLEGNAGYNGSATVGGMTGGLMYTYNNGTGTVGEGQGLKILANSVGSTGAITLSEGIQIHTYGPAFTANNQTRIALQLPNTAQNPGSFTGCTAQQIWFSNDTTLPRDGIGWGVNDDTIIYRSGAAALSVTGSITSSSSITATTTLTATTSILAGTSITAGTTGVFPTSVASVLYTSSGLNIKMIPGINGTGIGKTLTLQGGPAGGLSVAAGGDLLLNGGVGNAGFSGNANGTNIKSVPGVPIRSGTAGSFFIYRSDAATIAFQSNDTGLGFFAATPVAQQSGDIGTALVALGLMSSATSTSNVVASGRQTAQTAADANVFTYAVPAADHSYLITSNILVTASTLHSFTTTCSYTDESNTARVLTLNYSQLTGAFVTAITNGTGASAYEGVPVQLRCKASTNVVIATTGTFTSVTYNVEAELIQLT